MQAHSVTDAHVVTPCCSDQAEGAVCRIESGKHPCACAESKHALVSLHLPDRHPGGRDVSSAKPNVPSLPLRSGVLFIVACLTSPCCTPVLVPLGLALLANTPLAFWLPRHLGWVYTALTIICVSSLILALLSLQRRSEWSSGFFKKSTK